jgi:hypothetical protein
MVTHAVSTIFLAGTKDNILLFQKRRMSVFPRLVGEAHYGTRLRGLTHVLKNGKIEGKVQ